MRVFVLGGSYFLGKHFVKMAKDAHEITVMNRGNRPLAMEGVKELIGDRNDPEALSQLQEYEFDAVVDFCGYKAGDIEAVVEALQGKIKQYLFVSTADVYERQTGQVLAEDGPLEERHFGGDAGDYIDGKVALEKELKVCCEKWNIAYTSFRPVFIYGPDNYAPREGLYFHWISEAGQILHPEDATGEFQMVYVEDVAKAILNTLGMDGDAPKAVNLAPSEIITYEIFLRALQESVTIPFQAVPVPVSLIVEKQVPLPFPLTREESNWYKGDKALNLIGSYTKLSKGLKETWEAR